VDRGRARVQLHRLDLGDEAAGVVRQQRRHDVEHGVTEAADVQDVVPLRGLRRAVGLEVDADQLGGRDAVAAQPELVPDELLPPGRYTRRAVRSVHPRPVLVHPKTIPP